MKYPESVTIQILNWEKYQDPESKKSPYKHWWFRVSNDIFLDSKFRFLSHYEKVCFLLLLTFASKKRDSEITSCIKLDCNLSGSLRPTQYFQALNALQTQSLIRITPYRLEERRIDKIREEKSTTLAVADVPSSRARPLPPVGAILEFQGSKSVEEELRHTTHKLQRSWLEAYASPGPEWIKQELKKAIAWLDANTKKRAKHFGRFMTNWLSRAFEEYRKTLPSNAVPTKPPLTKVQRANELLHGDPYYVEPVKQDPYWPTKG